MGVIGFLGITFEEFLAATMPIFVYWVYSGLYMVLGSYYHNYRLHPKQDEDLKNLVPKSTVVKGVLWQQVRSFIASIILYTVTRENDGGESAGKAFSFIVIARQWIVAMVALDTYHYFLHRAMHQNKFLYRNLHSHHHKLLVPYPYGAIYQHPIEGFLFDIVGGVLSFIVSGMSIRTSIFFFSFGTMKNVDDHCVMMIPGNPFHLLFANNTAYHDLHHQLYGGKYNFAQPFFSHWDKILGTYMPFSIEKKAEGGFETRPTKACK